ncbi:MAG TPA: hypothetical protein VNZ01_07090 [Solirubrobacteraceae bacterium]|jgi:hypothetical protein|nr:hypothetical protein [Solirubrobacteraceae bacterium]
MWGVRQRVVVVALAVTASSVAVAVATGAPSRVRFVPASGGWEVGLLPPMSVGEAGWCIGDRHSNGGGFDCGAEVTEANPIIAESWGGSSPPPVTYGYAVTLERVRAVSIDGETPIPTRTQPNLPGGLRAVAVEAPGELFASRLLAPPRFIPLDEHGSRIETPQTSTQRREGDRNVRFWNSPSRPRRGLCRITVRGVPGLEEKQGAVLTHLTSTPGIVDRGLLPCASGYYEKRTWPLRVSILLDALHPGASPPVAIPGMTPIPGHPGDFGEIAPLQKLLARRHGNAWLLIEGGATLPDRLAALTHLHIALPKR